jgi:hypothetical protein
MFQRVAFTAFLLVTLASVFLLGLVWHQTHQAMTVAAESASRTAEAQAISQAKTIELLTQSQATSAEILKQLQTMAKTAQSPPSPDWVPVAFKLTLETPNGPPAAGYEVVLYTGTTIGSEQSITRESDTAGVVDFGVVHPGDWTFEINRPRDDQNIWTCRGSMNVLPGTSISRTIVCPWPSPAQTQVMFRVEWPADLAKKDLRLAATFVQSPTSFQPQVKWNLVDSAGRPSHCSIVSVPGLHPADRCERTRLDLWASYDDGDLHRASAVARFDSKSVRPRSDSATMEPGAFLLKGLVVLRPGVRAQMTAQGEQFEVVAHACQSDDDAPGVQIVYRTLDVSGKPQTWDGLSLTAFAGVAIVAPTFWRQLDGHFSARLNQVNELTLRLPKELADVVRQRLEENPKAEKPRARADNAAGLLLPLPPS